jgi:hypothetical protein
MNRLSLFALGLLFSSATCFGQSPNSDSQTLQALLSEVRLLRQDMRSTFIATQRAQILIYRLQAQEAAVARTSQRLSESRDKLARIQDERSHLTDELKRQEEFVQNADNPANQRKDLERELPRFKARFESVENQEQQAQARETEAQQQERDEELRLTELREQLDRLDKTLENASRVGSK